MNVGLGQMRRLKLVVEMDARLSHNLFVITDGAIVEVRAVSGMGTDRLGRWDISVDVLHSHKGLRASGS